MKIKQQQFKIRQKQQGVVLAVSLIMLVLVTLLAVSGMRATTMEERMVGNSNNKNMAFQMAETVLREAEAALQAEPLAISIADAKSAGGSGTLGGISCFVAQGERDYSEPVWTGGGSCLLVAANVADEANQEPEYYIEYIFATIQLDPSDTSSRSCFYQITARGYGADANSHATIQSTYKFPSCS